jgi:hypothetical protein
MNLLKLMLRLAGVRVGSLRPEGASSSLDADKNSLLLDQNSLFFEIISLFARVGNCSISDCSTVVSCAKTVAKCLKIAKFPVKFPDSRESPWRRARSALRRQPQKSLIKQTTNMHITTHSQRFHVASCRRNFRLFSRPPKHCRQLHATWTQHGILFKNWLRDDLVRGLLCSGSVDFGAINLADKSPNDDPSNRHRQGFRGTDCP